MKCSHIAPETQAVNAGLIPDPVTKAISPNISMSVNNSFMPGDGSFSAADIQDLTDSPFLYASWSNPTVRQLERRLATLEQTEDSYATTSGMAAISSTFLALLKHGDHMLISDVCYAGVSEFALNFLTSIGIEVTPVNLSKLEEVKRAIRPNTVLVHAETPSNPILRLTDLRQLAECLKPQNILLSVDSTFATPAICKPATLGADLVIHSLTKFINGHGDAMGGCVAGSKALVSKIRSSAGVYLGNAISAQNAWLIMRGVETLYPRMKTMCDSALAIAKQLELLPRVKRVNYPGLASHEQWQLASEQMAMGGAIISFQVDDMDLIERRFASESKLFYYAYSIGHQRSLAVLLRTEELLTSFNLSNQQEKEYTNYAGKGLIRLSIGLENTDDLIEEVKYLLR